MDENTDTEPTVISGQDNSNDLMETTPSVAADEATHNEPILTEVPPCAPLSERFGALVIDLALLTYGFLFGYQPLMKLLGLTTAAPLTGTPLQQGSIIGIVVGIFCGYFFLFEWLFKRTPGKWLCGLTITHASGRSPSLYNILVRNLIRPIDFLLFPITGFGMAEVTLRKQRLGDTLGRTTVRYRTLQKQHELPATLEQATIAMRSFVLLLDLCLFAVVAWFYWHALPISNPLITRLGLAFGPILGLLYWVGSDVLFGGTPVKILFGLRVSDETGAPVRLAASIVRNLFRVLDHNPIGYLCAVLSSHKQRPGDFAAQTYVVRQLMTFKQFFSFLLLAALTGGIIFLGINNEDNFRRAGRTLHIGPWTVPSSLPSLLQQKIPFLKTSHLSIPKVTFLKSPPFTAGEIIYLSFDIMNFQIQEDNAWLTADLVVTDSDKKQIINIPRAAHERFPALGQESHQIKLSFLLPLHVEPGVYQTTIVLRDHFKEGTTTIEKRFEVR